MSKTMTLHVRYTFWYISFPSSAKQQREMTSFKLLFFLWRTGTHEGEFFFSYWTWALSLRIQFPDSSKAHRIKINNISSKPEMAKVSACADVFPRCLLVYNLTRFHETEWPRFHVRRRLCCFEWEKFHPQKKRPFEQRVIVNPWLKS